ncbi:MAG: DUF308 domain-containing protein [Nocardioidaceae bacterium]|nr:DUF308 domain-containing protein [Nocardioidaceae bacterium]
MQPSLAPTWQMLVVRGVLGLLLGILAIAWPISTALALITLFGIWALVDGVSSLVQAFVKPNPGLIRVALALMGLVGVVAGFVAIVHPINAAVTLTWFLGIWLIARGVMELLLAFTASSLRPQWLILVGAVIDFVLGIMFALNPGKGALGIATFLGIVALAWGAAYLAAGFALRKVTTAVDVTPAA